MAKVFNFPKKNLGNVPAGTTLQVGSRGQAVVDVQMRLHFLGYKTGAVGSKMNPGADGNFGLETQKGVTQFQVDTEGLTVTGVVDAVTWNKLDTAAKAKGFKEPVQASFVDDAYGPPGPAKYPGSGDTAYMTPPLMNAADPTPFFQTDFGKKSIVVLGGLGAVALLAYIVKSKDGKMPRAAMNGYGRFLSDVSSNVKNSERRHGPPSKVGTRSSTRKGCSRTPASKMLVDAEVLQPE